MKQFITIEVKSIIMKTSIKTSCLTLAIFNNVNVFCRCSYRDKKNNTNSSKGGGKKIPLIQRGTQVAKIQPQKVKLLQYTSELFLK